MTNYTDTERVIDLKDLLYRTARQWRKIIIGALIIALLAGLYQVVAGLVLMLDDGKLAEAQEKYEVAVADYEATGERLRTSIANLRTQSANQQEYNSKSELMRIDPMNKWQGSFQLYIDSKYQIDPSLTYQNPDLTNRLIAAYSSYLRSGELFQAILGEITTVNEIRFLAEIYSVGSDPGNATITVSCVGKSEADVREILDFVKTMIAERYDIILSAIGDHSYEIMTESVYSTIDLDLDARQKANLLAISDYTNSIGEKTEELTQWERSPKPRQEFGTWYTLKQTVKYLIFGGIIGLILMFCWFAIKYAMSSRMYTEEDWNRFGLPVLGRIRKDETARHFRGIDALIDRLFARGPGAGMQQDCALAAHNLSAILRQNGLDGVTFVGNVDRSFAESVIQAMGAEIPASRFSYAGDLLTEAAAVTCLEKTEKVALLAENCVTSIKNVNRMWTLLNATGTTPIGVVVID